MQSKAILGGALAAAAGVCGCGRPLPPAVLEAESGWARWRLEQGEVDAAVAAGADLVRRSGGASYARLGLAAALYRRGDLRGAEEQYRLVLAAEADSAPALFNLGRVLLDQGRASEGRALLERFVARHGAAFPELAAKAQAAAGAAARKVAEGP